MLPKKFSSELYHHGVKGQKWGVRRYQNKDGTLTAEGRKRLSENAGYYMNAPLNSSNTKNRKDVSREYENVFWKSFSKDGYYDMSNWTKERAEAEAKLWNSFLDKYADATLKDLGYSNSKSAKDYVKRLFDDDTFYRYDVYDSSGKYLTDDVSTQRSIDEWRDYDSRIYKNKRPI